MKIRQCFLKLLLKMSRIFLESQCIYRVAQNKIPHQTIYNISATSGLISKILEAA